MERLEKRSLKSMRIEHWDEMVDAVNNKVNKDGDIMTGALTIKGNDNPLRIGKLTVNGDLVVTGNLTVGGVSLAQMQADIAVIKSRLNI
jgi:hypothetical protein